MLAAVGVTVIANAESSSADTTATNPYTQIFSTASGCYQTYVVPEGVTQVGIDAIGVAGTAGQDSRVNGIPSAAIISGGSAGLGSEVNGTVTVKPGQTLYIGVANQGMEGETGGDPGSTPADPLATGAGGNGGNASWVTGSSPIVDGNCDPASSQVLAVAAGGGGGGGASTYYDHTGGNGGTETGPAATDGGNNGTHDGAAGGNGGSAGGASGSGGHGSEYSGFPVFVNECLPGEDGGVGTAGLGGFGGSGAQDPTSASNCQGYVVLNGTGTYNGGGGGGGGGYFGGGGGGGADDADTGGAGGGGGAGSSFLAGQTATPTVTTADPTVTITPVVTLPQFTSGPASGTCVADVYCSFTFATTGFPLPSLNYTSSTLDLTAGNLHFQDNGNGTATLAGVPSPEDVGSHSIVLLASNYTSSLSSSQVTQNFPLTIGYGPLSTLTMSPTAGQAPALIANSGQTQFSVEGQFTSGYQRDLSSAATWASTNLAVATVTSDGLVLPHASGTFMLSATYGGQTTTEDLTVSNGDPTNVFVTPANTSIGPNSSVGLGTTLQLQATAVYANGASADVTNQVAWKSIGVILSTITQSGLATATGTIDGQENEFQATLTNGDGSISTGTAMLTVSLATPTSITVTPSSAGPLAAGGTQQFTATGHFPGGLTADITNDVTWTSSNTQIGVFGGGTPGLLSSYLTAGGGNITVTATAAATASSPNGTVFATATAQFASGQPTSISIGPTSTTIGLGQTQQLTATATYSDGSTAVLNSGLTWHSTAPSVVTVSSSGLMTGVGTSNGAGSNVGVTYTGPSGPSQANTIVTLSLASPTSVAISPTSPTMPAGSSLNFTAIGTYPGGATADISTLVLWSSSNTQLGVFSSYQLTTASTSGGQNFSVSAIAPNNVSSPSTPITVPVGAPTSLTVTLSSSSSLTLGHTEQATATANYANGTSVDATKDVTWASSSSSVLSVDGSGVITSVATTEGASAYVTATLATGTNSHLTTGSSGISTTLLYPTSLTLSPASVTVAAGGSQAYTAIGNYPGGRTVDVTSRVSWTTVTGIPNPSSGMENNVFVASASGPTAASVQVAATWGSAEGATPVTIGPPVTITGPSAANATAGVPFSQTFTAAGGSGNYTWSYSGDLNSLQLSSTTGSSVTISGIPAQFDSNDNGTLSLTDATYQTDGIVQIFNVNVGQQSQSILFTPPPTAVVGTNATLSAVGGGSSAAVEFSVDGSTTNGSCFVRDNAIAFNAAGTCVLDANQNGDNTEYLTAPQVQATITVGYAQTLGFSTTPPSPTNVGSPYTVTAIDTGDVTANPITLSVDPATTNSACSLTNPSAGSASVAFNHTGLCVLDANQPAGASHLAAAPIQQSITVTARPQSLAFSTSAPTSATVTTAAYTPTVTAGASGQPVILSIDSSTTNSACVIVGAAVQLQHAGTCVIDANQAGNVDYVAASQVQQTFLIARAGQSVSFTSNTSGTSVGGSTHSVAATATSGLAASVTIDSASSAGACQLQGATLTLGFSGTCIVDAGQAGSSDYVAASEVQQTFTVTSEQLSITSPRISASASALATHPFTVELVNGGSAATEGGQVTIQLGAYVSGSPSATATFASTSGGAAVSTVTIPAGSSSVTAYFGDSVAESLALTATEQSGALGTQTQTATITAGTPIVTLGQGPSAAAVGAAIRPAVIAHVADALGNPIIGTSVSLVLSSNATTSGASATTDATGTATFGSFSVSTPGTFTVQASIPGPITSASSGSFRIGGPAAITSISPAAGLAAGGTSVTIHGSGFLGATSVSFGSTAATSFSVTNNTTITAVSPALSAGGHDITVTTPIGTSPTAAADVFTSVATASAPTVTALSPTSGPIGGGTSVTITGTGFTGVTKVKFGTVSATSFTVVNSTTITAVSPEQTPAAVDVTVTTPNGTSATVAADRFTIDAPQEPAPTVTAVSPSFGPTAGGTSVTITGTGFNGATATTFGSVPAASFTVVNDTTITAVSPALVAGNQDVSVTTGSGTSPTTPDDVFTAQASSTPPPTVSSIGPSQAVGNAGTLMSIYGTNFFGATSVQIGTTPVEDFTVINNSAINVHTPALAAGSYDVTVTTPNGTSAINVNDTFVALVVPAVTGVSPSTGPAFTADPITITGNGFTGVTLVMIGNAPADNVDVVDSHTITATTPRDTSGPKNIEVYTANGETPITAADVFTMITTPSVDSIAPEFGPLAGGTSVVLTGSGFTGATGVSFGSTPATSFTLQDDGTITAVSPAMSAGDVDITVTNSVGTSPTNDGDVFSVQSSTTPPTHAPTVTAVGPAYTFASSGAYVTITGTHFTDATSVKFGSTSAASFSVLSDTSIGVYTPTLAPGSYDVTVTTANGTSTLSAGDAFIAYATPAVTKVSPAFGPSYTANPITITGVGFTGAIGVMVGGSEVTDYTVVNDHTITAETPADAAGADDVRVYTLLDGETPINANDVFTDVTPPTVDAISPESGSSAGGTTVTITGMDLTGATAVQFGSADAKSFTVVNDTTVTAVTPALSGGVHDVTVTTHGGPSPILFADQFTAVAPSASPSIIKVSPTSGPTKGGTTVTITGKNFSGSPAVFFGTTSSSDVQLINSTTITAVSPAAPAGAVGITVETSVANSTLAKAFTYFDTAPTVTALSVTSGPLAGNILVTIRGTEFADATKVEFGTVSIPFTLKNGITIVATVPVAKAGVYDVRVENAHGTSAKVTADQYTVRPIPLVMHLSVTSGPTSGDRQVTILGFGFTGATSVTFGAAAAEKFTVVNSSTIVAFSPPQFAGKYDVRVTTSGGVSATGPRDLFAV